MAEQSTIQSSGTKKKKGLSGGEQDKTSDRDSNGRIAGSTGRGEEEAKSGREKERQVVCKMVSVTGTAKQKDE